MYKTWLPYYFQWIFLAIFSNNIVEINSVCDHMLASTSSNKFFIEAKTIDKTDNHSFLRLLCWVYLLESFFWFVITLRHPRPTYRI